MNNKVILLGESHYHGLNLLRSFGRSGIRPDGIIIGEHSNRFLEESKYWGELYFAVSDQEALEVLEEIFGKEQQKPVVIPWSDGILSALDAHYDSLSSRFILASVGGKQGEIARLTDKKQQEEWAEQLGIRTNRMMIVSFPIKKEDVRSIQESLSFPLFLKPVTSCEGSKEDMRRIDTAKDLVKYCSALEEKGFERILVQEYLDIDIEYDFMGYCAADSYSYTVVQKCRVWPINGGAACFGKVTDPRDNAEYWEGLIRKLRQSGYCGPFDMDIFEVGGELYFNEINWRSSANVFAAVMSGNNYPYRWYLAATGQDAGPWTPYAGRDLYFMNEFRDFRYVVHGKLSMGQWIRDVKKTDGFAFRDEDDPKPFRVNLSNTFTGRLPKRKEPIGRRDTKEAVKTEREEALERNEEKDRSEFVVVPKPDHVTYDMIAEVLADAHRANEAKGMHFATAHNTGEEIAEHLGENGLFLVAMDGETVAACGAVKFRTWDKWFCKGQLCGDVMMVGVREEYKGRGLGNMMFRAAQKAAFERCRIATMNTAEGNTGVLNSRIRDGWRLVDYFSHDDTDFYSPMLAVWRDQCPYSEEYCEKKYRERRMKIRLLKKEKGGYRLWAKMIGKK